MRRSKPSAGSCRFYSLKNQRGTGTLLPAKACGCASDEVHRRKCKKIKGSKMGGILWDGSPPLGSRAKPRRGKLK